MFGQFKNTQNVTAANLNHHRNSIFSASGQPFLSQSLPFIQTKASSFAGCSIHQHTVHSFCFQILAIFINDPVVHLSANQNKHLSIYSIRNVSMKEKGKKIDDWTHLSSVKAVKVGHIKPVKWNLSILIENWIRANSNSNSNNQVDLCTSSHWQQMIFCWTFHFVYILLECIYLYICSEIKFLATWEISPAVLV